MYRVIQYFASGLQNYGLAYVQWNYRYLQNNSWHLPYMEHGGNFYIDSRNPVRFQEPR